MPASRILHSPILRANVSGEAAALIRNPGDTFDYKVVPAAITADRTLNLPLLLETETVRTGGKVRKAADETVNNSANLQNDDALLFTPAVNSAYHVKFIVFLITGGTPDFKWAVTVPAGAEFAGVSNYVGKDANAITTGVAAEAFGTSTTTNQVLTIEGILTMGATAGNCQFQWAQNTATAEDTKVLTNSLLFYERIA